MANQSNYITLALPKGRLLQATANLLDGLGLGFEGYGEQTRQYRLKSTKPPYLSAKIFWEKDIPIQVAIGNYDLGICGLDWIEELLVRYKASAVVKMSTLNYGEGYIYAAISYESGISNLDGLLSKEGNWRIVSEYPDLAEAFALNIRMRRFRIFPVWGDAEVYPPENAEIAVLWARNEEELERKGLLPLMKLLPARATVIASRESLNNKDLASVLNRFASMLDNREFSLSFEEASSKEGFVGSLPRPELRKVKLALPDGHQQPPTAKFLERAGLNLSHYSGEVLDYHPSVDLDWLGVKVIRPQDMPLQVANGNFDLAITGKDWLLDHVYRFPSSPVVELLDLGFGKVKVVAAVSNEMPASTMEDIRQLLQKGKLSTLRVASEYVNISDKYLCDHHVSPYKLIPTWGASEAFLPEDADLLIDNMQTGKTMAEHNLKIIDILYESTACLIGNKESIGSPDKKEEIDFLIQMMRGGLS
jgi:ATP phosphoribosyltransferase